MIDMASLILKASKKLDGQDNDLLDIDPDFKAIADMADHWQARARAAEKVCEAVGAFNDLPLTEDGDAALDAVFARYEEWKAAANPPTGANILANIDPPTQTGTSAGGGGGLAK